MKSIEIKESILDTTGIEQAVAKVGTSLTEAGLDMREALSEIKIESPEVKVDVKAPSVTVNVPDSITRAEFNERMNEVLQTNATLQSLVNEMTKLKGTELFDSKHYYNKADIDEKFATMIHTFDKRSYKSALTVLKEYFNL